MVIVDCIQEVHKTRGVYDVRGGRGQPTGVGTTGTEQLRMDKLRIGGAPYPPVSPSRTGHGAVVVSGDKRHTRAITKRNTLPENLVFQPHKILNIKHGMMVKKRLVQGEYYEGFVIFNNLLENPFR